MLKSSILAAVVIATPVLMPVTVLAQDKGADTVIATVNDQPITLGHMIVMRQSIQDPAMSELSDQELWDLLLEQLIRQTAVADAGEENAGTQAQMELQHRSTLAASAVAEISKTEPTDQEIQAAYDKLFANADATTEYSAAHILVKEEELAKKLKKEIDQGADFGELAEENSTDTSGPNKGDLGWFAADQMVAEFSDAVKKLEPGQVSEPIKSQFGWHLIKLNDTRVKEAPKLEEVRDQLAQLVLREKVEAEIERLTTEAKVEKTEGIDVGLMNKKELLEAK